MSHDVVIFFSHMQILRINTYSLVKKAKHSLYPIYLDVTILTSHKDSHSLNSQREYKPRTMDKQVD